MKLARLADALTLAAVFLWPWQTRWIFSAPATFGGTWEYGVLSVYAIEVLVLLAVGFACIAKPPAPSARSGRLFALAAVFSVFTLSVSYDPALTAMWLVHVAFTLLLAWLVWRFVSSFERTQAVLFAFTVGLILPCGLGIWQVATGGSPAVTELGLAARDAQRLGDAVVETDGLRLLRAYGSFPHPNMFGGVLVAGLVAVAALRRGPRWMRLVLAAMFAFTLALTFSRSAWLAAMVLAAVAFYRSYWSNRTYRTYVFASALGVLLALMWQPSAFFTRAQTESRLEQQSVSERRDQVSEAWSVFKQHAWVGVGAGAYTFALTERDPQRPGWQLQPVHNVPLLVLAELGIVGVIFLLLSLHVRSDMLCLGRMIWLLPLVPVLLLDHYLWTSWAGIGLVGLALTSILVGRKLETYA